MKSRMKIFESKVTMHFSSTKKPPFALLQQLANEFNLSIIRKYGEAGHDNRVIDVMSSFGAKKYHEKRNTCFVN